jgi:tRNA(Ile)-lysidine synthase
MKKRVLKTIETYGLLSRGDRCILAVSGGADSMALLYVLSSLREELGIELRTVHVHHGLRGAEADRDAAWVEENCAGLDVPCEVRYVDVKSYVQKTGGSVEEAARILRYRELYDAADSWDEQTSRETDDRVGAPAYSRPARIAVAHNLEDDAETILMQMARGSGLKGLGGISAENGRIIRPFLHIKRRELEDYLNGLGIPWVTDSTNLDDDYTRNRVRHRILPELESGVNSAAAQHIAAAGELISQAYEYICAQAEKLIEEHADVCKADADIEEIPRYGRGPENGRVRCRFPADVLQSQPQIMRSTVIMLLLERVCGTRKDISAVHINDITSLTEKETGKYVMLPYGLRAGREYGYICIERYDGKDADDMCCEECGQDLASLFRTRIFAYSGETVPAEEYTKWFDYDKINVSVTFRWRTPGDYIQLGKTGRKSIAAYMTDRKIPAGERDRIPLAADGDHIMWIVGYRISEAYKVTETTTNVLEIMFVGQ